MFDVFLFDVTIKITVFIVCSELGWKGDFTEGIFEASCTVNVANEMFDGFGVCEEK